MKRTVLCGFGRLALVALAGCATMETVAGTATPPQVKLERVEVASYFPYAPPPARVPMVLAFVFNLTNPNAASVTLDDFRFSYAFEASGQYFTLNSPAVYDTMHIPGRTTNTLRVVSVLDSAIVPATLAVTQGFRLQQLGLKGPDVVKDWWEKIGDFGYGIRVSEGVASFSTGKQTMQVTFQDAFPKK